MVEGLTQVPLSHPVMYLMIETIDYDNWLHNGFKFCLTAVVRFVTIIVSMIHVDKVQIGLIILLYSYYFKKAYLLL